MQRRRRKRLLCTVIRAGERSVVGETVLKGNIPMPGVKMIFAENLLNDPVMRSRLTFRKITPAAVGGMMGGINIEIGEHFLQFPEKLPGRLFVETAAGKQPEAFQRGEFLQDGKIFDFVEAEIQVHQMTEAAQRRDIPDFVFEQLGIFQMGKTGERRNIGNMIAGDNQNVQVGKGGKPVQPVHFVMTDIQGFQIPAVFQDFKILGGMAGGFIVVEGREGGVICADDVFVVFPFSSDQESPAPFYVRISSGEAVAEVPGHEGVPHIDTGQVGKAVEKGFEGVEVRDDGVGKVYIF